VIQDQFIAKYAHGIQQRITELKDDLAKSNFHSNQGLYAVGSIQGLIRGLTEALDHLNNLCEELDN